MANVESLQPASPPEKEDVQAVEQLLLNVSQVAQILNISRGSVYSLQCSGRFGPMAIKLGKRSLWSKSELVAWVEAGCPSRNKWVHMRDQRRK